MSNYPLFVNASDILQWAEQRSAETQLPWLISRLIRNTDQNALVQGFRRDKGVVYPGWDGRVDSAEGPSYVPRGHSVWEVTAEEGAQAAATRNFNKRTQFPLGEITGESTFVFVTPHRWPGKDEWQRRKILEGHWKDVRAYDSDDIAAWLEDSPVVMLDFSIMLGKPTDSQSLPRFWHEWSTATEPPTSAGLILAGREAERKKTLDWLNGTPAVFEIQGNTAEEAIAFFGAVLKQPTDEQAGQRFIDRAVVVNTPQDWIRLAGYNQPLILIARQADRTGLHVAVEHRHHVLIPLGPDDAVAKDCVLPRLSWLEAHKVIETLHKRGDIDELTQTARHSIGAYRRRIASNRTVLLPQWLKTQDVSPLVPALFLMHWNDQNENDRKLIERLTRSDYESFIAKLNYFSRQPDPPIRKIANTWTLVSARDCWETLGASVTDDQLNRFHDLALEVLGEIDPMWNLADEQRWYARALNAAPQYSDSLHKGISRALAVMGAVRLDGSTENTKLGACASWIVRELLDGKKDWQFWASLNYAQATLAEAAPEEYLRAVERDLVAEQPVLPALFQDQEGVLFSTSPHNYLLWALETLAWSPDNLAASSLALARLARLDPGGKTANRPASSLARIFCSLHPCTAASAEELLSVLALLRVREPETTWHLLMSLLPDQFGFHHDTAKPHYRDWVPDDPGSIETADTWSIIKQVVDWILNDAGLSGQRWKELVEHARMLNKEEFDRVMERLLLLPQEELPAADKNIIWETLRHLIALYRKSGKGEKADYVSLRLAEAETRFLPDDPVEKYKWLFGLDVWFDIRSNVSDWSEREKIAIEHQKKAVIEIWNKSGVAGLLRLGECVARSDLIGWALGETPEIIQDDADFMGNQFARGDKLGENLALGFLNGRIKLYGKKWLNELVESTRVATWSSRHRATLYQRFPQGSETWDRVASAGADVESEYWKEFYQWFQTPLAQSEFERLIDAMVGHGRLIAAAQCIQSRLDSDELKLPVEAAISLLFTMVGHDPTTEPNADTQVLSYTILELLKAIETSGECPKDTLAQLQSAYLPFYKHNDRGKPEALYEVLGDDPSIFIKLVCRIWKRRIVAGEIQPAQEADEEEVDDASNQHSYNLLREWHLPPGVDRHGNVDTAKMNAWVNEARRLAKESGRAERADYVLGEIFSHMPTGSDGAWPHEALRDLIERMASEKFERGLYLGLLNSRGATTRGPEEGGEQERALAENYRTYLKKLIPNWSRTRGLLTDIANNYDLDAKRHDDWRDLELDGLR